VNSLNKSNDSAYQYIIEALRDHDFALNTLSKNVEKAITQSAYETELLKIKVNEMATAIKESQTFIIDKEAKRDAFFEKMHADEMIKIISLDKERRENREAGQEKLSHKIYEYLKESRELIYSETRKSTQYALKQIKIALEEAKQQAIISSHKNISEQFGKHTINKKD
jgi:hypothetical protein